MSEPLPPESNVSESNRIPPLLADSHVKLFNSVTPMIASPFRRCPCTEMSARHVRARSDLLTKQHFPKRDVAYEHSPARTASSHAVIRLSESRQPVRGDRVGRRRPNNSHVTVGYANLEGAFMFIKRTGH